MTAVAISQWGAGTRGGRVGACRLIPSPGTRANQLQGTDYLLSSEEQTCFDLLFMVTC